MQYQELYQRGVSTLAQAGVAEAKLDARLLLEAACKTDRTALLAHGDREVSETEQAEYLKKINLRAKRIPLQHILGETEFMGLPFLVNENVLCPRQDTEILTEEALRDLHDGMRILDMCTGSGCILLSLLHYSNNCQGVGTDISKRALQVARENAKRLFVENAEFIRGDLFENVTGKFEIIVCNPPYIRSGEIESLMPEVRDHEPKIALDGRADGLFFYREIAKRAREYLMGGGGLYFETGFDQGEAVKRILQEYDFKEIEVIQDFAGLDRVVKGTLC